MRWPLQPDAHFAQADGGNAENLHFLYIVFTACTPAHNSPSPLFPGGKPLQTDPCSQDHQVHYLNTDFSLLPPLLLQQNPSLGQQIVPKASECDYFWITP